MYYVKMVMECYEIYYILHHFRTYYIGVLYFQMDMEKLRGLATSSFFYILAIKTHTIMKMNLYKKGDVLL